MTTHADGWLFNADDIRHIVIQGRMLGLRRERVLAALTRPLDDASLTSREVRRMFDEEWPADDE
jgi:hypothetical protein